MARNDSISNYPLQLVGNFSSGQLLQVEATSGNLLIICHRHYAELVGARAAVGGLFDLDCHRIIPIGTISFSSPESTQGKQQAINTRHKWMQFTQQLVLESAPLKRAAIIYYKLYKYCGLEAIKDLPDEILAQLVGVLPETMTVARQYVLRQIQKRQPLVVSVGR